MICLFEGEEELARLPNLYTDTAGVKRFDYVVEAVKQAGAHKVLFGSDGPWLHPALELQKVRLLKLPPDQEAFILGENLLRLLPPGHRRYNRAMQSPTFTPRPA